MKDIERPAARQDIPPYAPNRTGLSAGCVILASGLGRRFGSNKLLADFQGKPLISHILDKTGGPPFACRLAVTRHETVAALCGGKGYPYLLHSLPQRSDTIRLGLEYLLAHHPGLDGCLFCPADQPLISPESLNSLVLAFSQFPDRILRLGYHGQPGSPVLFGRHFFPELLDLPEGKGGSFLAQKYPEQVLCIPARDIYELYDADTPQDLARLAAVRQSGG